MDDSMKLQFKREYGQQIGQFAENILKSAKMLSVKKVFENTLINQKNFGTTLPSYAEDKHYVAELRTKKGSELWIQPHDVGVVVNVYPKKSRLNFDAILKITKVTTEQAKYKVHQFVTSFRDDKNAAKIKETITYNTSANGRKVIKYNSELVKGRTIIRIEIEANEQERPIKYKYEEVVLKEDSEKIDAYDYLKATVVFEIEYCYDSNGNRKIKDFRIPDKAVKRIDPTKLTEVLKDKENNRVLPQRKLDKFLSNLGIMVSQPEVSRV